MSGEFSYHGRTMLGVVVMMLLFVTPLEVLAVAFLVPGSWLRWLLLLGHVHGLLWLASL